ncbi:O52B2 protein, partial [Odontophorus gujanensis]|nr:O52B2 protein [Odontophorus gujanensis]
TPPSNLTSSIPATFVLAGIPGMEKLHVWLSIPFCSMYLAALLGNSILLLVVRAEQSLHQPMYLLLCMLAAADLMLSTTAVPKMLALFWLHTGEISFGACLTQMFFLHFSFSVGSVTLLAMALDRFVAICHLLRYAAVLTPTAIVKVGLLALLCSFCIIFPCIFLLRWLPFCGHSIIPHTDCEHMGIGRLACADISANVLYGLAVPFAAIVLDVVLIAVSYVLILLAVFRYRFSGEIPRHIQILLANLYVLLPPLLNPIVYGVREKVGKMLLCPTTHVLQE